MDERMAFARMVARHVGDPAIVSAFAEVPRERFLFQTAPKWQIYSDDVVVTYRRGSTVSTSSQPSLMAQYMAWAKLKSDSKVLEIGSGTGYNASVMSRVCRRGFVVGVEYCEEMVEFARDAVGELGYSNVDFHTGDGFYGCAAKAPYDAIIVTVAINEIPVYWFEQLQDGGRIVAPINLKTIRSDPTILLEKRDGKLLGKFVADTRFIPARGAFEERYEKRHERLRKLEGLQESGISRLSMPRSVLEFASQKIWVGRSVYFVGEDGYAKDEGVFWRVYGDALEELEEFERGWRSRGDGGLFEVVFELVPRDDTMVGSFV